MRRYSAVIGLAIVQLATGACGTEGASEHDPAHHSAGSPYTSYQTREIKALSPEEVEGLAAGDGLEMALAAELNGYPGPKHALELMSELKLTARQRERVSRIYEAMRVDARTLGHQIIEAERVLDEAFAAGAVERGDLEAQIAQIALLRAELRFIHLAAHLELASVLSEAQMQRYHDLRGYGDD